MLWTVGLIFATLAAALLDIANCDCTTPGIGAILDPLSHCPDGEAHALSGEEETVFRVVDCNEPGARWDYHFEVNITLSVNRILLSN
jgi:hypothetical protein